jgi:hypothetical protein
VRQEQENVLLAQLGSIVLLVVRNLHLVMMGITVRQRNQFASFALQVTVVSWLTHRQSSVQLGATHPRDN